MDKGIVAWYMPWPQGKLVIMGISRSPQISIMIWSVSLSKGISWSFISFSSPKISPFTLIGATTRSGLLTSPLRARFGINSRLEYYKLDLLSNIVNRSSSILDISIAKDASLEIARRSRGTPRIANALL